MSITNNKVKITKALEDLLKEKFSFKNIDLKELKVHIDKEKQNLIKMSVSFVDKYNHHYRLNEVGEFYELVESLKLKAKRLISDRVKRKEKEDIEYTPLEITKEKEIILSYETTEQAINKLEELGHSFYIFRNSNNDIKVVYRRIDGTIGEMLVK